MRPLLSSLALVFVVLLGCAGSSASQDPSVEASPAAVATCLVPNWYKAPPERDGWIVQASTRVSQDLQTAYDKATLDARAKIAEAVEVELKALEESVVDELDMGNESVFREAYYRHVRSYTEQRLAGSRVVAQSEPCQEAGRWRAYVLMAYPRGEVWKGFLEGVEQGENVDVRVRESETVRQLRFKIQQYDRNDRYRIEDGNK